MITHQDLRAIHRIARKFPYLDSSSHSIPQRHIQHLIEVAIVDGTLPSHAEKAQTHDVIQGCRVETIFQKLHVLVILPSQSEKLLEARDRHVGETVETIEDDAESLLKNLLVVRL